MITGRTHGRSRNIGYVITDAVMKLTTAEGGEEQHELRSADPIEHHDVAAFPIA